MNAVTDITAAEEAVALDPSIARAEARLRDLEAVRGVCMSVVRLVQQEALALEEPQDDDLPDEGGRVAAIEAIGRVIDRAARSVRLTVILEEKVEKIIRDLKAGRVTASVEGVVRRRRDAVERVVMTAISDKHGIFDDKIERDREHLDDYLGREDFAVRPVSESVRRLCDMLGLRPDWKRWANEPWADEEAEAGVPGSPYRVAGVKPAAVAKTNAPVGFEPGAEAQATGPP